MNTQTETSPTNPTTPAQPASTNTPSPVLQTPSTSIQNTSSDLASTSPQQTPTPTSNSTTTNSDQQPASQPNFTITTVGPGEKPSEKINTAVKNNIPLLLLLVGAVVAAGISGVYFYTASRAQPVEPQIELRPSSSPQVITTPIVIHQPLVQIQNNDSLSKDAASKITAVSNWLASMKKDNNVYYHNQYSQNEALSQPELVDNRTGIYVAWGLYNLWTRTQDAALLTTVEAILQSHADTTIVNTLQPDFLSCRLLYDIASNPQSPTSIVQLSQRVCDRSRFIVPDISKTDALNGSSNITPVPPRNLSAILNTPVESLVNQNQTNELEQKTIQYAAFTSDFVGRAWWYEKTNDAVIATSLFNLAVNAFEQSRTAGSSRGTCNVGLASIDMFQLTQEEQYLLFAKNIFTENQTSQPSLLIDKISCLLFTKNLNMIFPAKEYQDNIDSLRKDIIENQFDQKVGAFYSSFGETKIYGVLENGLITGLLSQL